MPWTTGQLRKYIIPKVKKEVDAFTTQALKKNMRYGIVYKDVDVLGDQYTEFNQEEDRMQATLRLELTKTDEVGLVDGYSYRVPQRTYAGQIAFSWEVMKYKKIDVVARATMSMKRMPLDTVTGLCVGQLELGNTTTGIPLIRNSVPYVMTTTIDKLPIFSNAHRWKNNTGITNSNYLPNGSIDEPGLNDFCNLPFLWKDPNGRPVATRIKKVIVPTVKRHTVAKYLKSNYTPDSGNNAINTVHEDLTGPDFEVMQDLTLTGVIYGETNADDGPQVLWSVKPDTMQREDVTTDAEILRMAFACNVAVPNFASIMRLGIA